MRGALVLGALLLATAFATPAAAQVQSWDGSNPFTCTLQNGAALQDPAADPFCVEYDHNSLDPSAIQQLLTDGPNQLATLDKCFLYRVDRFTSTLGEVDTAMFVNKATGTGGSAVTHATIPISATGGTISVPVVQSCGATQPQSGGGTTSGGGFLGGLSGPNPGATPPSGSPCKNRTGNANNGLGRARLGLKPRSVIRRFGKPTRRAHRYYHYCLRRGGDLAIHFGRGRRADVVMTSGKSFHAGKVRIGSRLRRVRSALHHERVLGHNKGDWVIGVTHRHWRLLVGLSKNRVVYIAAVSRKLTLGQLGKVLNDAGR